MAWCNPGAIVPRPRTDALVSRALSAMCLDPCGVVRAMIGERNVECSRRRAPSSCVPATPATPASLRLLLVSSSWRISRYSLLFVYYSSRYVSCALRPCATRQPTEYSLYRTLLCVAGRLIMCVGSSVAESGGHYSTHCSFSTHLSRPGRVPSDAFERMPTALTHCDFVLKVESAVVPSRTGPHVGG